MLDLEILDILVKSDFPRSSFSKFGGITRPELRRMPLDELESFLSTRLPPTPNGHFLVDRFMSNLAGYLPSTEQVTVRDPIKVEVKQEPVDSSPLPPPAPTQVLGEYASNVNTVPEQQSNHAHSPDPNPREPEEQANNSDDRQEVVDSDSDVEIVGEVMNVSIIGVLDAESKAKKRILDDVTLEDDDVIPVSGNSSRAESPISKVTKVNPVDSATTSVTPNPAKVMKTSTFQLGKCIEWKGKTRSICWSMAEFQDFISQSVEELSIVSNCSEEYTSVADYNNLSLPNLTTLKILNSINEFGPLSLTRSVNYSTQLSQILAASPFLVRVEVSYEGETALTTLLQVLGSVSELPCLSSLIIRHKDKFVSLLASNLTALGQITAPNLKELHLACCIRAEGDGSELKAAFQNILLGFPNLTTFKIEGSFVQPASNTWPKIVLNFPKLVHLRILQLGARCQYLTCFESVDEQPPTKKKKKSVLTLDPGEEHQDGMDPAREVARGNPINIESDNECFPISISFQGLMPSLEVLDLGVLYEFPSLYFPDLPALKVFLVASGWTQFYPNCFPTQTGRKGIRECRVEELQFPDSFQDCFLITKILPHFPSLNRVYFSFPTVKFLRSFAKTMATRDSFECLVIRFRFDFASSLNSCVLDNIAKPSDVEMEQLKILRAYPHWKEYVKENQIELPQENPEDEDPEKFCGLGMFFEKLKYLCILHFPRTLRLPKGPGHWINDPQPEYTSTVIGFKEYPFSKDVETECPPTMKLLTSRFDMSQVAEDFDFESFGSSIPLAIPSDVLLVPSSASVKQEVKHEKSTASH